MIISCKLDIKQINKKIYKKKHLHSYILPGQAFIMMHKSLGRINERLFQEVLKNEKGASKEPS